jgi:hypothetical protein
MIRDEQFAAMRRSRLRERVRVHVGEDFPEDCAVLGEEQVRDAVELGIERAGKHGFHDEDEVQKYIKLMFVLGSYFDEDPLYRWAALILTNGRMTGSSVRMHNLYATAAGYLEQTAGPDGEAYRAALVRARRMPFGELTRPRTSDPIANLQSVLFELYPEQYRALDQGSFDAMVAQGDAASSAYGVGSREGRLVYFTLMFMAGSHFDHDPLHAWVAPVLRSDSVPDVKARELHRAAMARLDRYRFVNRSRAREER